MTRHSFILPNSLFLILHVTAWLLIGLVIINHNVAPLGRVTLNWPNPAHASDHFQWQTNGATTAGWWPGGVWLRAGQSMSFSVRLPRGFATGQAVVIGDPTTPGFFSLQAETLPMHDAKTEHTDSLNRTALAFAWPDLVAHGREFSFTVRSTGPDDVIIRRIEVTANR